MEGNSMNLDLPEDGFPPDGVHPAAVLERR